MSDDSKKGIVVKSLKRAEEVLASGKLSLPLRVIPSYVLEKDRNRVAHTVEEFTEIVRWALDRSPIREALLISLGN